MSTMTEQHPSFSAIGTHLDEEMEIAALAHRYYDEEGHPEGRAKEHWERARREMMPRSVNPIPERKPTRAEMLTEEMMHLDL